MLTIRFNCGHEVDFPQNTLREAGEPEEIGDCPFCRGKLSMELMGEYEKLGHVRYRGDGHTLPIDGVYRPPTRAS